MAPSKKGKWLSFSNSSQKTVPENGVHQKGHMAIKNLIQGSPTSRQTCFGIGAYLRYRLGTATQMSWSWHSGCDDRCLDRTWLGHWAVFYGETRENRLMNDNGMYPLVIEHNLWKITIVHGKIHYIWWFSLAMLNYQRVARRRCFLGYLIKMCRLSFNVLFWGDFFS